MKIIKKEIVENRVRYLVASDEHEWLESQKESYKILAKQLKVHGFRPGHIPEAVIKKHIPESEVMQHALKKVIDANYRALLDDKEFNGDEVIIDALSIDIAEMQPNTLQIVYAFEEYPVVTLGDYKKIKIDYLEPEVTPAEIDREIEKYIKKDIMLFPKEADHIAKGDMVNFDFKGLVDNKPFAGGEAKSHELEIGSNTFIPGFEEQMIGLKKGEKKTIEVVFPKDYQVEDLAGKPVKFELVINDIKTIQRPEIDEAYIARFSIPAVKTPTEFREYINKQLLDYKQYNSKQNATRQISEWLINNAKLSYIPQSLLNAEMERLEKDTEKKAVEAKLSLAQYITKYLGYQDDKAFNQAIREAAEKNLHLTIAIEKIIDDFKINVNENELNEHLEKMAQVYGTTAADIKQKLINNHNLEGIRTFITQGKMFDKLIEINKVNK